MWASPAGLLECLLWSSEGYNVDAHHPVSASTSLSAVRIVLSVTYGLEQRKFKYKQAIPTTDCSGVPTAGGLDAESLRGFDVAGFWETEDLP